MFAHGLPVPAFCQSWHASNKQGKTCQTDTKLPSKEAPLSPLRLSEVTLQRSRTPTENNLIIIDLFLTYFLKYSISCLLHKMPKNSKKC